MIKSGSLGSVGSPDQSIFFDISNGFGAQFGTWSIREQVNSRTPKMSQFENKLVNLRTLLGQFENFCFQRQFYGGVIIFWAPFSTFHIKFLTAYFYPYFLTLNYLKYCKHSTFSCSQIYLVLFSN